MLSFSRSICGLKLLSLFDDKLNAGRTDGVYHEKWPVHSLMQSRFLTPELLTDLIATAKPEALLKHDNDGRRPFHFLKYRRRVGETSVLPERTDDAVANVILGVANLNADWTQLLLQQAAEHAYVETARRLVEECNGNVDKASLFDSRTPRQIGKDGNDAATRAHFDDSDQERQRARHGALNEYFERSEQQKREACCKLFLQTVLAGDDKIEPWGLGKGEFQTWLRKKAGPSAKKSLVEFVDLLSDIDGMTVLNEWVEVGFDGGKQNYGKVVLRRVKEHIKGEFKAATVTGEFITLLGQVPKGKKAEPHVISPGGLSFYAALLRSCEKRSLLTDYRWVKMVGEGSFGRAHLCR